MRSCPPSPKPQRVYFDAVTSEASAAGATSSVLAADTSTATSTAVASPARQIAPSHCTSGDTFTSSRQARVRVARVKHRIKYFIGTFRSRAACPSPRGDLRHRNRTIYHGSRSDMLRDSARVCNLRSGYAYTPLFCYSYLRCI